MLLGVRYLSGDNERHTERDGNHKMDVGFVKASIANGTSVAEAVLPQRYLVSRWAKSVSDNLLLLGFEPRPSHIAN